MPGNMIAQLMGHARVDTTLNVHAQVLDRSVREAADRVGSTLITIDHTASEVAATTGSRRSWGSVWGLTETIEATARPRLDLSLVLIIRFTRDE